ncbi:MAG TPA: DUF6622 family protein [Geminicoccus sp.]|jgi:hypothetical protein|uniref:DUF6622 family protein n=1 Tax=Geminicoccus sp. TaxID=2024832 RepID=UPI002E320B7D|nr:DUF6622 family protein [Geminicoccus sp.]HEX2527939.1 DUF6622 family protein [Geminicoccus sp.]
MDRIVQILAHTPWWVYALFAYLISRGLRARKPVTVTLRELALFPALLTGLGLVELHRIHGFGPDTLGIWLLALAIGIVLGILLLRRRAFTVDRAQGVIHRPTDPTVLPLILLAFVVKYAFGVIGAMAPDMLQEPAYRVLDIGASGLFAGIFLGKFGSYVRGYLAAPHGSRPAVSR